MKVKKRISLLIVLLCTVFVPFTSAASTLFSLTSDPGKERVQDWCLNGSKILYTSDATGNIDIYSMNPDGSSRYQITTSSSDDRAADCNLSGNTIVYSSQEGGYSDIWTNNGYSEIWTINIDGTNPQQLTNDSFDDLRPSMSPDGTQIAFSSDRGGAFNIWTMNIDGSNLKQITSGVRDTAPQWSPDGSQIVYHSGLSGDSDIFVMNADGTNQRQVTYDPTWAVLPSWSSDGSRIVFLSNRSGNRDIWVIDADGGNLTQLTTDAAQDTGSRWSPDGAKIAITSDRAGTQDIWVYEFSDESVGLAAPQLSYSIDGVSVSLSWSAVPGASGYRLNYAPYPYTGHATIESINMQTQTSFNVDLWDGAAYYVAMQSYDDAQTSEYSNIVLIQVNLAEPDPTYDLQEYFPLTVGSYWNRVVYDGDPPEDAKERILDDYQYLDGVPYHQLAWFDYGTDIDDAALFRHDDQYLYFAGHHQFVEDDDDVAGLYLFSPIIRIPRFVSIGDSYNYDVVRTDPNGDQSFGRFVISIEESINSITMRDGSTYRDCLQVDRTRYTNEIDQEKWWWCKGIGEVKLLDDDGDTDELQSYFIAD